MKWLSSSLLSLFLLSSSFAEPTPIPAPVASTPNWIQFSFALDGTNGYYDTNIDILEASNYGVIEMVSILIIFPQPKKIMVDGEKKEIKSVVVRAVVDCQAAVIVPAKLYSFDIEVPTEDTKPIAMIKYQSATVKSLEFSKTSPIYKLFCPIYA